MSGGYGRQQFSDLPLGSPTYQGGSTSRVGTGSGRIPASFASPGMAAVAHGDPPKTISVQALNELEASVRALREEVYGQRMAKAADEAREARIRSVLLAEEADKKEWEAYHLRSSLGLDAVPPDAGMSPMHGHSGSISYGLTSMRPNPSSGSVGQGHGSIGTGLGRMSPGGNAHPSGIQALSQQVAALSKELKDDTRLLPASIPIQGSGNIQADMDQLESILEEVREAKLACRLLAENVVNSQRELMKARSERSKQKA